MPKNNLPRILVFILLQLFLVNSLLAKEVFSGRINEDRINVRVDSTTASQIICRLNSGDVVEVVKTAYDWYKIRLPKSVSLFVRQDMVSKINDKSGKITRENVNVRFGASESAPIIGRVDKGETVSILEEKDGWSRINAPERSFGWVHKKFVDKITAAAPVAKKEEAVLPPQKPAEVIPVKDDAVISIEGIVEPYGKIFGRKGTHKLITHDNKVFLLKGNTANLNAVCYRKVKATGKIVTFKKEKYPVIEILRLEILN